jgi:hypothetical protein
MYSVIIVNISNNRKKLTDINIYKKSNYHSLYYLLLFSLHNFNRNHILFSIFLNNDLFIIIISHIIFNYDNYDKYECN